MLVRQVVISFFLGNCFFFEFDGCIFGVLGASPSCQISFLDSIVFARIRWLVIFNHINFVVRV